MNLNKLLLKSLSVLLGIAHYTEQKWGKKQRNIYLKQLDGAFKRLGQHPLMGRKVDEILPNAKSLPEGYHNIIYQDQNDYILIIRVLHGRMKIDEFFNR